jgi:hypothetical protein
VRAGFVLLALTGLVACDHNEPSPFLQNGDPPNIECEASNVCAVWGWCGKKGDECVAISDQKCRESKACRVSGLCSMVNGLCIARSSSDCEGSQYCEQSGYCSASEGVCK